MDKSPTPETQEKQHVRIQKHWYWLFRDTKPSIGLVIASFLFIAVGIANQVSAFIALAVLILVMGILLYMLELYQFNKSYYECTESDFIDHLQTALTFNDTTVHYNLIREVNVKQTPMGNALGFGQIEIDAGGADKVILPFVKNHQEVKEYLIPRIGPVMPTPEPAVVTDEQGELRELEIPRTRQNPNAPKAPEPKKEQVKKKKTPTKKRKAPTSTAFKKKSRKVTHHVPKELSYDHEFKIPR